jgi:hypothetical protein
LSLKTCAALSGYPPPSPVSSPAAKDAKKGIDDAKKVQHPANPVAQKALERLLTPYIAQQLNGENPNEVTHLQTKNYFP